MRIPRIQGNAKVAAISLSLFMAAGNITAQAAAPDNSRTLSADKAGVIEHWTEGRRAGAIPRDLVVDPRGLGYLRRVDGSLEPYGHQISAAANTGSPKPLARPSGGGNDTTAPRHRP